MFKGGELFSDLVVPLVSAQFYFVFLLYFIVAGKTLTKQYLYYILFLFGFSFFLITKTAGFFTSGDLFWALRCLRVPVLFIVAAPCLVIATARHCRMNLNKALYGVLFLVGAISSLTHSALADLMRSERGFLCRWGLADPQWAELPLVAGGIVQTSFRVIGGLLIFIVPCAFLLVKEVRGEKRTNPLAFISGTLLFGIFFVVGNSLYNWSIYYVGSLICAAFWGWAIFSHIREMRDFSAGVLKERLDLPAAAHDTTPSPLMAEDADDARLRGLVERAKEFICTNYQNDLLLEDIARSVSVSVSHFARLFKKCTGKTAKQYLTEVRMEHAKILLFKKSVTDTAFAVGFNDSNYFSTVFKKHTGQTPTQFQHTLSEPVLSGPARRMGSGEFLPDSPFE